MLFRTCSGAPESTGIERKNKNGKYDVLDPGVRLVKEVEETVDTNAAYKLIVDPEDVISENAVFRNFPNCQLGSDLCSPLDLCSDLMDGEFQNSPNPQRHLGRLIGYTRRGDRRGDTIVLNGELDFVTWPRTCKIFDNPSGDHPSGDSEGRDFERLQLQNCDGLLDSLPKLERRFWVLFGWGHDG